MSWLPDLARWAQVVASHLAVGDLFYMVEFHPLRDLLAGQPYFGSAAPDIEEEATYTDNGAGAVAQLVAWSHPLSSVINALMGAGIRIKRVDEFSYSPYDCFEGMVEREPGRFSWTTRAMMSPWCTASPAAGSPDTAVAEPYPQACCKGHRARPTSDRGPWICEASLDLDCQGRGAAETNGFPELIS